MTTPVTGPVRTIYDFFGLYKLQDKWRQKRPFTLALQYNIYQSKLVACNYALTSAHGARTYIWTTDGVAGSREFANAQLQSYERFLAKLNDRSSMGENILEINKSLETIRSRAFQVAAAVRDIRRKDFKSAMEVLFYQGKPNKSTHGLKAASSNWLEFHLGIQPLLGDIWNAMNILSEPLKSYKVRARGFDRSYKAIDRSIPLWATRGNDVNIYCQHTAEVAINNPNLWLANQMGVLNPFQVAWQMIPMSFVLDYFINVEGFLGSFTDLFGLAIEKAATTLYFTGMSEDFYWSPNNAYGWEFQSGKAAVMGMRRTLGISTPSLQFRPLKAQGWQRALTEVSLLIPHLKSLNQKLPTRKSWGYGGSM